MAIYAALKIVHLLSIVMWVGGMFFAHFCMRPVALTLPPDVRLPFLRGVLGRFFAVISVLAPLTVVSGALLVSRAVRSVRETGASFNTPLEWWLMGALGLLMLLVFVYIRLVLFRRMQRAVDAKNWPVGAAAMNLIRHWVFVNLSIGVAIIVITLMGQAG
jgi:uncharacterized membrane protein